MSAERMNCLGINVAQKADQLRMIKAEAQSQCRKEKEDEMDYQCFGCAGHDVRHGFNQRSGLLLGSLPLVTVPLRRRVAGVYRLYRCPRLTLPSFGQEAKHPW